MARAIEFDVVCPQETKAQECQLEDPIFRPQGYHCFYFDAEKKGMLARRYLPGKSLSRYAKGRASPSQIQRVVTSGGLSRPEYCVALSAFRLFRPERQERKLAFMAHFEDHMRDLRRKRQKPLFALTGTFVINKLISKIGARIREIRDFSLRSEPGWTHCMMKSAGAMRLGW